MKSAEKRILVVDDDEAIRTLLLTILQRHGFAVDTARDGDEALDRLQRCAYALVLLDLMMPHVNGWQVLDVLAQRDDADRPVVIVLTAGTEPRDFASGLVAGSVRKPFDVQLLLDAIAACIAAVGERQQLRDCPPPDSSADDRSQ